MPLDRVAAALAAMLGLALFEAAPRAASRTLVALEYEPAPDAGGCPDAAQFGASVGRQLGYDPFRAAADRRVAVQIARREIGFDGWIQWSDGHGRWVGERRLSSRRSDCADIAASLAFSVAVQIQLLATLAPSAGPEPIAASPPSPAPASPPPAPARPPGATAATSVERPSSPAATSISQAPPAVRARWLALSIGLGPSVALGLAPGPTGLGRLFARGRRRWFSLELAMDAALPATQHAVGGSGFSLDRFAAEGAACGHARALAACFTTTLGRLQARGFGVDAPASPAGTFSQVGARFLATRDFGDRYFASARVDGLIMVSSWTVTLNSAPAWTTPRVGALLGLDVGARFF